MRGVFRGEWTHPLGRCQPRSGVATGTAQAFGLIAEATPNPGSLESSLAGLVNGLAARRAKARSCLAQLLRGWDRGGGAGSATENVSGWAMRFRLFQLEGAEGQQPEPSAYADGQLPRSARQTLSGCAASGSATRSAIIAFAKAGAG